MENEGEEFFLIYKEWYKPQKKIGIESEIQEIKQIIANSHFLRTAGSYSADSQEHTPDTNDYAAKGSLHE